MATVTYKSATCTYPKSASPAVDALDLEIRDGEFLVLVGPSGSGKSTALRMLAGLEDVTAGAICIDGVDVSRKAPKDRDIAMVFQNYALYPHMSVGENMAFALKIQRVPRRERAARVREAAAMLDLEPFLARKPKALSGGQRQRVAMGRAIVREPGVFLFDEPLSNLDAKLRVETRANIAALQARLGTTTLYVTHDQVEAMTMGHRVAVLKDGVLQQCDTPRALYERPANAFVAGFIGSPAMNLFDVAVEHGCVVLDNARLPLPVAIAETIAIEGLHRITLGVRPESISLATAAVDLVAHVELVEELGADAFVYASAAGVSSRVTMRIDGRVPPRIGDELKLSVDIAAAHFFDPTSGERLA